MANNINRLSAIMLGRMEMSVQHALDKYDLVGNEVFGRPRLLHSRFGFFSYVRPKYPSRYMRDALITVIKEGLQDEIRHWKKPANKIVFQSDEERCRT